ncbi:HNH endonuclease [Patescibacteria group bacterium]|nr:HNH endonuclease [Patescibacteria group bacterium]
MTRSQIPRNLKRKIIVEAGHRCAIPSCRFPTTEIAHIESWTKTKEHKYENLIAVCPNCHTRYDNGEIDKKSMLIYKQKLIFLSDRYTKFELNTLNYLRDKEKVIVRGYLLVQNLIDDGLVQNVNTITYFTYSDGIREDTEFVIILTEKGKQFIDNWINSKSDKFEY